MAKINLAKAQELSTAAEYRLVEASRSPQLNRLSEDQLKKNLAQARKVRDKWRDLATRQQRETQQAQGARQTDQNARSREKSELFAAVVSNFEARLEAVTGAAGNQVRRKEVTRTTPSKEQRAKGHRATRAQVREKLEEERELIGTGAAAPRMAKKKAAKKKAAPTAQSTTKSTKKKSATQGVTGKKKTTKKATKKKAAAAKKKQGVKKRAQA